MNRAATAVWLFSVLLSVSQAHAQETADAEDAMPVEQAGVNDGLDYALREALQRNPSVKVRQAELESLEHRVDEARGGRLPSVTIQAQSLSNTDSQGVARLSQPLWAFGRIDGAVSLAKQRREVGTLQLLQSRRQLITDVGDSYTGLYGLWQRFAESVRNLLEHQRLQDMIVRRASGGLAADADVRLAIARVAQARVQRDRLRGELERQRQQLEALVQLPVAGLRPVDVALMQLPPIATLLQEAERAAAAVRVSASTVKVARAEAGQRQAELLPTISARIERDLRGRTTASDVDATRAGLVLEATLSGGGYAGYQRVQAENARIDAAEAELEAARIEARRNAQGLLQELKTGERLLKSQEEAVAVTADNVQSYLRLFDAGKKSWLDVLNTQRELSENRQTLEETRTSLQQSALRLAALTGRLDVVAGMDPNL